VCKSPLDASESKQELCAEAALKNRGEIGQPDSEWWFNEPGPAECARRTGFNEPNMGGCGSAGHPPAS